MKDLLKEETVGGAQAILVGLITRGRDETECEVSMDELERLLDTAGGSVYARMVQAKDTPDTRTCIGSGKVEELAELCRGGDIKLVIFDCDLSPAQIKNLEKELDSAGEIRVIDRSMLILDIFALHATSAEGKIQVELAQLKYTAPRLMGKGTELSRLGGGIGTRGPGETKLESDKRHIHRRINSLEAELREIQAHRDLQRSRREKDNVVVAALVGYTNAGKSTILNYLTESEVLAENMLFATLDPTARKLTLPNGQDVMLIDTVGFVSRLPHDLVKAFKSTLEEAAKADIILNVCDASDEKCNDHINITTEILKDLGCVSDNIITVMNKCDKSENLFALLTFNKTVMISALKGINLDLLLKEIEKCLEQKTAQVSLLVPYSKGAAVNVIRNHGKILSEEFTEEGTLLKVILSTKDLDKFENYII